MFEQVISDIISGKVTMQQALLSVASNIKASDEHILWHKYSNKNVFVRTVTHHYTGTLTHLSDGFLVLSNAAWIADDGRFNECLKNGTCNEVEPYPRETCVSIGSIVDVCQWDHELPRVVK
jgi:hypothetical protein